MTKKLVILGGNPETKRVVERANSLGVHTIVVDPNPDAPAKKSASSCYDIDGFDVDSIVSLCRNLGINGVLVGVADILVKPYQEICERLSLPCYANKDSARYLTDKEEFVALCKKFKIGVTPTFEINSNALNSDIKKAITLPVLIKPIDSGGGVGMTVCRTLDDVNIAINIAIKNSKKGRFLVERYMECDDLLAYYNFYYGKTYLAAIADRYTSKKQSQGSPVCIGAVYPSKHALKFINSEHPKLLQMFNALKIDNGVLNIQFFSENNHFFAYDPGFRLQGEAPHVYLENIFNIDNVEMLINFSLGKKEESILHDEDMSNFKGKCACTMWVLLNTGKIKSISGLEIIKSNKRVIKIIQRLYEGDKVLEDMIGTERQVFARIYIVCENFSQLSETVKFINFNLNIINSNDDQMILDVIDHDIIENNYIKN